MKHSEQETIQLLSRRFSAYVLVLTLAGCILCAVLKAPLYAILVTLAVGLVADALLGLCGREVLRYNREQMQVRMNQDIAFTRVAKDIRELMNTILNLSDESMVQTYNPIDMNDALTKVNASGSYLMSAVNDLFAIYKVSGHAFNLQEAPETIEGIFVPVIEMTAPMFESKNQHFTVDMDDVDRFRYVNVDAPRIQQILMNLLSNASKFTPEDGHITLSVNTGDQDDHVEVDVIVTDDGIGMSQDCLDAIMDVSIDDIGTTRQMGMTIISSLTEAMGAKVTCESSEGEGSKFTVHFSWAYVNKDAGAEDDDFSVLAGKHILLVEDNEMNANITRVILDRVNVSVDCAYDGRQGVAMFMHAMPHTYDAILMDLRLPVLGGADAARAIRESTHPEAAGIPIIAMTADVSEDTFNESREAGMNEYITKPIDPLRLFRILSGLVTEKR